MSYLELTDGTADRYLLDAPGLSLLVFYSRTCGTCRVAREQLPALELPVDRLCWIDAGANGGLVARYEVFHLPSLFLVRDGAYYGPVSASLAEWDLRQQIGLALDSHPAELP
ncbi:thioredoxin family protein [Bordetella petrii]|uniref:thioredoxin family protein n=1 Tax=Bordetella petrii TaxID=94624 RepID=UPI00372F50AB